MKSNIFKSIMRKDVPQKTVIFADVFNLNITGFKTKEVDENTHRIEFISGNTPVGYIDAKTSYLSPDYPETDMPFVLYTPIGKVTGHYSSMAQMFLYEVDKKMGQFKELSGIFGIKSHENKGLGPNEYDITSSTEIVTNNGVRNNLVFNSKCRNYEVEIESTTNYSEKARMYFDSRKLCIDHFNHPNFKERKDYAKIRVPLDANEGKYQASYEFIGEEPFSKDIEISGGEYTPYWKKVSLLDFDEIRESISLFDDRMSTFIDEVRNSFILLANGLAPVSLYDKLAHICFHSDEDKYKLDFSGAQNIETRLEKEQAKVLEKVKKESSEIN